MDKPRIALIVDQPQRDLAGLVLTAFELCQQGAVCHLVPSAERAKELWALAPDLVVLFSLRRGFEQLARDLKQANIKFGLLDAEGGVWVNCESYAELLWDDASLKRELAFSCAWGPTLSDYLISKGLLGREQTTVTGCPRFDFYHPMWRGVLSERQAAGSNGHAKTILINTNSTEANPRYASLEEITRYYLRFGWTEPRIKDWLDTQTEQLKGTITLARDLAKDYPHCKIVLRPHPFESPDIYRSSFREVPNVEINVDGPVQSQIFNAAAVVQRSCTTAIEAGLASVPALSPQWLPTPTVVAISEGVSIPCNSYLELRDYLNSILQADSVAAPRATPAVSQAAVNLKQVIHDWFHRIDGQAHKRVAEIILQSIKGERTVDEDKCKRNLYGLNGSMHLSLNYLSRVARHRLNLAHDWSFSRMRRSEVEVSNSDAYLSVRDVEELTGRISSVLKANGTDCAPVNVRSGAAENAQSRFSITLETSRNAGS